jgi:hypothetical protein
LIIFPFPSRTYAHVDGNIVQDQAEAADQYTAVPEESTSGPGGGINAENVDEIVVGETFG